MATGKLVLALDYRGHGQSEYDRNPDNYTLPLALADLSAVLIALETAPAIFIGTSYGGLLAMMLAAWRPTAIAGVIAGCPRPPRNCAGRGAFRDSL
jgi:pimeloyl-ACP methyl ester carboxylesterase